MPEQLNQYQITGLLFNCANITETTKSARLTNEYINSRKQELQNELSTKKMENFDEYLTEKSYMTQILKIERQLFKANFKEHNILNSSAEMELQHKAQQLFEQNKQDALPNNSSRSSQKAIQEFKQHLQLQKQRTKQNENSI